MSTDHTITAITPTFLLKGIDPIKILSDYIGGKYNNMVNINLKPKITKSVTPISIVPKYGTSTEDQIYIYKDKSNINQTVVTTNHEAYTRVKAYYNNEGLQRSQIMKVGTEASTEITKECMWCRTEIKGEALGIPISIEILQDRVTEEKAYVFHIDGNDDYCCFECCFSGYKRLNPSSVIYRDPLYMDAEQMLKFMYSCIYPHAGPLREAQDYRLLKRNNGPLTEKEFFNETHAYVRTSNIILLPAKIEYLVTKKES